MISFKCFRRLRPTLPALLVPLLVPLLAPAGAAAEDAVQSQLEAIRAEMEKLRTENAAMRTELGELRSAQDEAWMSEERSKQVRSVVQDVLADAGSRESLMDGFMAGWRDHFFLASPDGKFKLAFEGHTQFRWVYNFHDFQDRHISGFENTRSKLTFRGHVFNPDITYLFRTDATRNEPGLVDGLFFVRDMWMRFQLSDEWAVRAGQFKLPFNREELVSSAYQLAVERSLMNEGLNIGRSQGVELQYADARRKFYLATSDGASDNVGGFHNITGNNPVNTDALSEAHNVEWAFTGRWEELLSGTWQQFEDFTAPPDEQFGLMLGVALHYESDERTGAVSFRRNETPYFTAAVDLSAEWGGANAFFGFIYAFPDNRAFGHIQVFGWHLQGGLYLTDNVEIFARWEYGWWLFDNANFNDLHEATFGVNYYIHGHDVKWTTDLGVALGKIDVNWQADIAGWRRDFPGSEPQVVFRTQIQLLF